MFFQAICGAPGPMAWARFAFAALLSFCAGAAAAQDLALSNPVDCDMNGPCYIQQYVDRDPGPGATDFMCAGLVYDGHKGTDFALPSTAMMQRGVTVRAAAAGVIGGVRDGMTDDPGARGDIAGRECGNGVRIEHAEGWSTQYCHMREGSIQVQQGQRVAAGELLGLVGQSGLAEFPHLHLAVRKDGRVIDPFDPDNTLSCDTPGDSSLWVDRPDYRPGGLISLGFATAIPEFTTIRAGTAAEDNIAPDAPALVIWAYVFGTREGDVLRLSIEGPAGEVIADDVPLARPQAQAFRAIGKKRRTRPWPPGSYIGTATMIRNGETLESRDIVLNLR